MRQAEPLLASGERPDGRQTGLWEAKDEVLGESSRTRKESSDPICADGTWPHTRISGAGLISFQKGASLKVPQFRVQSMIVQVPFPQNRSGLRIGTISLEKQFAEPVLIKQVRSATSKASAGADHSFALSR